MRNFRFIAACFICLTLVGLAPSRAQTSDSSNSAEYLIKAGFTYNFAKLIDWPSGAFAQANSPIIIGVLGIDPFNGTLDDVLKGKEANGRAFEVRHLKWGADVRGCNILFVSDSETPHLDELFRTIKGLPILTIGDAAGFAQHGGIINFVVADNRVRFEINTDAAKQANISISSRLLSLAMPVHQGAPDARKP
jgi:YfiR/HmsC-like